MEEETTNNFSISDMCLESYPCQHWVEINGKRYLWGARKIFKYFNDNNMEVPEHFQYVANLNF